MSIAIKSAGTFTGTGRTLDTDFEIELSDGTNDNTSIIDLATHSKVIFAGFTVSVPEVFFKRSSDSGVTNSGSGNNGQFNIAKGHDGNYKLHIANRGNSFAVNDTITIPGNQIGGSTPTNDATITVNTLQDGTKIATATITGTPAADSVMIRTSVIRQVGTDSSNIVSDHVTTGLDFIKVFSPIMDSINDNQKVITPARFTNPVAKRIILASAPSDTIEVGMVVTGTGVPSGTVVTIVNSQTDITLSERVAITSGMTFTFNKGNISLKNIDDVVGDADTSTSNSLSTLGHQDLNQNLFNVTGTQPNQGETLKFSDMYGDRKMFRIKYSRENPISSNDLRANVVADGWDQDTLIEVTFARGYVIQGKKETPYTDEDKAALYISGAWLNGLIVKLEGPETTNNPQPNNYIPGAAILGQGGNGSTDSTDANSAGGHAIAIATGTSFGGEGLIINNGGYIYGGGGGGGVMTNTANSTFRSGAGGGAGGGDGSSALNNSVIRTGRASVARGSGNNGGTGAGGSGSRAISPLDIAQEDRGDGWFMWSNYWYSRGLNGANASVSRFGGRGNHTTIGGVGGMMGGGAGAVSTKKYRRSGDSARGYHGAATASGGGGGGSRYIESSETGVTNLFGSNGVKLQDNGSVHSANENDHIQYAGSGSSGAGDSNFAGGSGGRTPGAAGAIGTGEHGFVYHGSYSALYYGFYVGSTDGKIGSSGGGGSWGAKGGNSRTGSNNPGVGGNGGKAISVPSGLSYTLTSISTTFQPRDKTGAAVGSTMTFTGKTQGATL